LQQSNSQKNWLGALAQRYHDSLTPEVRSYLESRGLDKTVVDGSLLGFVVTPDPIHSQYEGRLSIPFITPTGVVYMRFRCIEELFYPEHKDCSDYSHGKYEGVSGSGTHLFNVSSLHVADSVVGVCEGELDALAASHNGLASVGVPGANNWKPYYYRLFDDFERVLILGDGDSAGYEFTTKLAGNMPNAIPCPMPKGEDVSSFIVKNGASAFLEFVGGVS
jgi:DNA primase